MKRALPALRRPTAMLAGGLLALGIISVVSAQDGADDLADIIGAVDTAWLLIAGFLVFFMQAGFAMLTAGFVRSQETANILMKNMIDACVGGISFWLVGWAFAYGVSDASNQFIGLGNFALNKLPEAGFGHADWFFQFAFAAAAATIVAGALAGRTKYSAYLIYTVVVTGLIYPVVVHWGWDTNTWMGAFTDGDTWLGNGYIDFAGSGIVHTVGGIAGLMGAIVVGARLGKYGPNGEVRAIPGHNISIATIGMFILWFGWYGFNAGSTLALSDGGAALAASVAVTTTLAAGAGGVTAMLWSRFRTGRYDAGLTINGILAGLVAITAGTATVDPWAAVVIGAIGALVMYYGVQMLDGVFRIDDPVGAVSVHAFAGIWGVIAVGLFSSEAGMAAAGYANPQHYGLFLGGGGEQLLMQLIGIGAIVGWTAATAGALFLAIRFTIGLRVSEEEEMRGLDLIEHGIDAYPDFGPSGSGIFGPGGGGK